MAAALGDRSLASWFLVSKPEDATVLKPLRGWAVVLFVLSFACGKGAFGFFDSNLAVALMLGCLQIAIDLFLAGYIGSERVFIRTDVVGVTNLFGRAKTMPKRDAGFIETTGWPMPSLTILSKDGTTKLRLVPAVFAARQIAMLRTELRLPDPLAPLGSSALPTANDAPIQLPNVGDRSAKKGDITRAKDRLILRPTAESIFNAIGVFAILALILAVPTFLISRSPMLALAVFTVVFVIPAFALGASRRKASLYANESVIAYQAFSNRQWMLRSEFRAIELANRRLGFRRLDGSIAFTVPTMYWSKEQIKALSEFLGVRDVYSDEYAREVMSRGMSPPKH